MTIKRIIIKLLIAFVCASLLIVTSLVLWFKGGDEVALDYSIMHTELGESNPEINGYAYLREIAEDHDANYPDDYSYEVEYSLRANWDMELFEQILDLNEEFLNVVSASFDRDQFLNDQVMTPETMLYGVGTCRDYVKLRQFEIRVLQLKGLDAQAYERLIVLQSELTRFDHAQPGGMIGWLTSIALIGMLESELAEFQSHADLPAETWAEWARSYTIHQTYTRTMRNAFKQEFQFSRYCIDELVQDPSYAADLSGLEAPNAAQRVFAWSASRIGLKRNRTNNTLFRAYSEVIDQAGLPVIQRDLAKCKEIDQALSDRSFSQLFSSRNPIGNILLAILYPAIDKVVELSTLRDAASRSMQLSLALHAYFLKEGELPEDLNALVPTYLPSIPKDPFDGEPLRYSKKDGIVYSVGNDYTDDGGSAFPFIYQATDEYDDEFSESDHTEPTFPLRFLEMHKASAQ